MNKWKSKEHFKLEVSELAKKLNLKIGTVYVRPMSSKWASITTDGKRLYFNSELLDIKKDLGKYVITHELIHLKVPNHGKLFKSLMSVHLKDYKKLEEKLKYETE